MSTKSAADQNVNTAILQMRNICKIYGKGSTQFKALDGISLTIDRGEFVAIMGPSGSGKSTCMNILGSLDVPSCGEYLFCGVDVGKLSLDEQALLRRHFMGFVFQSFNLLHRVSALGNVELPLIYAGVKRSERYNIAMHALNTVGLANRASAPPNQLSGGQQQRVAIARALVTQPSLLLADEPTGNLDTVMANEIMHELQRIRELTGITIVMVTHEPDIARYADRVLYFVDGKLVKDSRSEELLK
jgi:putative ABC transport system ATP-binding protein